MGLTNKERIKAVLSIPAAVTFHDVAVGLACDFSNSYVLELIGQSQGLVATTRDEWPEIASSASYDLQLDHVPVVSVVAVTNGGALVPSANYRVDKVRGKIRLNQGIISSSGVQRYWDARPDGVVVTYVTGYDAKTVPQQLRRAADIIGAASFNKGTHQGKKRVRNAQHVQDFDLQEIPEAAQLILNQYVDPHHH